MKVRLDDFDYPLSPALIAQQPLDDRDQSRLLLLRRADGSIEHFRFYELPRLLRKGDLLVFNDTRVLPAKFFARRSTGARIEGLFLRQERVGVWEALLKNAGRCKVGEDLEFVGSGNARLSLRRNLGAGRWELDVAPPAPAAEVLDRVGATPLPPYIRRRAGSPEDARDRSRYQTVFAERPGAVAAPTAGLHFTPALLDRLREAGVERTRVTLHVGLGTFQPVQEPDPARHRMHSEWYELPEETAARLNAARAEGRRVVAVGTTSVRVLETAAASALPFRASRGWTDLFLYPPATFRAVSALLTNFHLPRSTLLMLVAAFCSPGATDGIAMILAAYRQAIASGYRFYSYGDAMLIE